MRQLQRKIDRARGMRQRTDRNKIDSGGGDLPHVAQVHSAARLELHLAFSDRDRFA